MAYNQKPQGPPEESGGPGLNDMKSFAGTLQQIIMQNLVQGQNPVGQGHGANHAAANYLFQQSAE